MSRPDTKRTIEITDGKARFRAGVYNAHHMTWVQSSDWCFSLGPVERLSSAEEIVDTLRAPTPADLSGPSSEPR